MLTHARCHFQKELQPENKININSIDELNFLTFLLIMKLKMLVKHWVNRAFTLELQIFQHNV